MEKEQVINLVCKKHIKIYKLHQLGLKNGEIAKLLQTNGGHVWNVLKKYKDNEDLIKKSDSIVI